MAKRSKRIDRKRSKPTPSEEAALKQRRALERAVRLQKTIRRVANELIRVIAKADDAVRAVGRMAVERDLPRDVAAFTRGEVEAEP